MAKPAALVTGANRGIGRGIALALAARGFDIVAVDLEPPAEPLAGAAFLQGDIAEVSRHAALADAAFAAFGRLDCLVNNAGVQVKVRGDVLDVGEESFDRVIGTNLRGTFFLTQAVARRMLAEAGGGRFRSIITLSSSNATIVGPNRAEYCFSKAALSMMVKLYAVRLAEAGIMCFEVRPGIIRTDMTRDSSARYDRMIAEGVSPVRRWGEPGDVGRAVAMLACGDLPFSTGDALHIDGGLHMKVL